MQSTMKMKKAGIICHPEVEQRELVKKIIEKLENSNIEIFFDPIVARNVNAEPTEINGMDIDLAVILGGDGTILWTLKELKCEPLILSINMGRFGFLSELKPDDALLGLDLLIDGKFKVEKRAKIKINNQFEALNEVSILPEVAGSLLEFEIKLKDKDLVRFRADGVIVSTQTGSTAYNLSAGGPIIHPDAKAFAITAINPFMHTQRPVVVPDDSKISIKLTRKDRNAYLLCDGILNGTIHPFESINTEKSKRIVKFVRLQ